MALFDTNYTEAVVSIEVTEDGSTFNSIATGFLVGFSTGVKNDAGEDLSRVFLVSNRHVFDGLQTIYLKFNHGNSIKRYPLVLADDKGNKDWRAHEDPSVDVGIVLINAQMLIDDGVTFTFIKDDSFAYLEDMARLNITQGDEVYIIGFPHGLAGIEKKYAIVKSGIISRLDEEIIETNKSFLIDSSIFPGNSGGPVILKPNMFSLEGKPPPVNYSMLLGIVSSYLTYNDTAFSQQTGQARITFVENAGLATVVPMDFVRDVAQEFLPERYNKEQISQLVETSETVENTQTVKSRKSRK